MPKLKIIAIVPTAALCFVAAAADPAFAQRGDRPTAVQRRTEVLNRQSEEYDRQKSSRDLKGRTATSADRRRGQELAEEVKNDFKGLQESYNQIVLFMADNEGLNRRLNSVFREVAEIKKYSARLKANLALPKSQQKTARVETNNAPVEELLMTLRKHIYDFVTNPLFESMGALDVEQGKKAGGDLDRIIKLSESITKTRDKPKN
ncbi:MAG: hypothetical protein ACR2H4_00455 [Pyrinomonadaceae bacterium]